MKIRFGTILVFTLFIFLFSGLLPLPGIERPIHRISTSKQVVALTFDDGPSSNTRRLLEILKQNHVKATFFVTGEHAIQYPDDLKMIYAGGHEIENHSYSHSHLLFHGYFFTRNELMKTDEIIRLFTGETPKFFRPPYGQYDLLTLKASADQKLIPVLWSTTAYDWKNPGPDKIEKNVLNGLRPGAIILFHDHDNDDQMLEVLPDVIAKIRSKGFSFAEL